MAQAQDVGGWTNFIDQFQTRPMTLVAVGKTGEGKSSTLNSLVKWSKRNDPGLVLNDFKAGEGPQSVSSVVSSCEISPPGFPKCRLVDTIGLFDTKLTTRDKEDLQLMNKSPLDEEHQIVLKQFTQVMQICPQGIDIFLFVIKGRNRATKEANETIDIIFRYLGWNMLEYVIFVITEKDQASQASFEDWRDHICQLLEARGFPKKKIQNRFLFVDNQNPTDEQCYEFLSLAKFINDINKGQPYTHAAFQEAQQAFELKRQQLKEQFEAEFQIEVDKKIKPIEKMHQAKIDNLQGKIDETEAAAARLKADQVEERKKFEAEIEKMKRAQEDEQRRMENETARQIQLLEQRKLEGYEKQMIEMKNMIAEITKAQADSNKQMLVAFQQLQERQRKDTKPWYEVVIPALPGLIKQIFKK